MSEGKIVKERFDGSKVEILGETYEAGCPVAGEKYDWTARVGNDRSELLQFLRTGLRYWYASEGFGSEKRKSPA